MRREKKKGEEREGREEVYACSLHPSLFSPY